MYAHILSVRHFEIVGRAYIYAEVKRVSCKHAVYLVFIVLSEKKPITVGSELWGWFFFKKYLW